MTDEGTHNDSQIMARGRKKNNKKQGKADKLI